ncbi:esterase/lipase family protein [Actinokineospora sp. HUAS TT18]|uniref:esterase/lipase family protein n=1 Tax=Actinokineospora sp. HUAS TT18 TaxID=3447451 RepID=UPI003F51D8EA
MRRFSLRASAIAVAAIIATTFGAAPAQAQALPEGGLAEAVYNYLASPGAVRGANDWSCKPTAAHPNPVVMLPGTFANIGANFVKAAPRLTNAGYCVFAMNYGFTAVSFDRVGGLDSITKSAAQLDAFVTRVRQATGAAKVDIIGHSQGGSVPMWWIKKMGGASQVAHYVGWAPSSHGTTLNGIVNLGNALNLMGFVTGISNVAQFPGVIDQTYSSDYTKALWADGNTVPAGPKYTVIATKFDTVVTPYTSQALAGANNIVLQDKCPWDFAGHVGLFNDGPTLQMTMNALADGPANFQPRCTDFGVQFI